MSDTVKAAAPSELLPCPFCGGDAELDTMQGFRAMHDGRIGNRTVIYCLTCSADMGFCHADSPMRDEELTAYVIGLWNARAALSTESPQEATPAPSAEPAQGAVRDALRDMVELRDCTMRAEIHPKGELNIVRAARALIATAPATPAVAPAAAPQETP